MRLLAIFTIVLLFDLIGFTTAILCIKDQLIKDIQKRIGMFEKVWKSSKLSENAKAKSLRLARGKSPINQHI